MASPFLAKNRDCSVALLPLLLGVRQLWMLQLLATDLLSSLSLWIRGGHEK